jgi:hypothetical protein
MADATFSQREKGNPLSLWERVSAEGGRVRAVRYRLTNYPMVSPISKSPIETFDRALTTQTASMIS